MKFNKRKTFLALALLSVMSINAQVSQTGEAGNVEVGSTITCSGQASDLTTNLVLGGNLAHCTDASAAAVDVSSLELQARLELGKLKSVVVYKPQQEGSLGELDLANAQLNIDIAALEGPGYSSGDVYRCDAAVTGVAIKQLHTGSNTGLAIVPEVDEGQAIIPVAPNGDFTTEDASTATCFVRKDESSGKIKIVLNPFIGMNMRLYGYEDSMTIGFSNEAVIFSCFEDFLAGNMSTLDQVMARCPIMTIRQAGVNLIDEIAVAKPYDNSSTIDSTLEDLVGISSQKFRALETQILDRENMVQGLVKVSAFVPVEFDVETMRAAPGTQAVSTFQSAMELNVSSNYFVAIP